MKTLKNKLLVALVVAFMLTLGAAIIPTVGMQVNAAETDSVQITLTDGIAVKYYATLGADVTTATATFESETTALNATVKGEKVGDKWLFVYNKVTPQYVDSTFSVKVNGEVRKENYSVLEYLNTIINGEYAQAEKTVAKDLVYYGEAAKAYKFGGEVAATPGTEYKGESKMSLGAKFADDTTIYSATVVFDTLPAITFGFKKASETATVTVDGKDVTNELVAGENGVYTYTLTGIYAVEFDKQYNVVLTDGDKTQTLLYSINDYAARMLSSANEAMKTLAKALYCYGAGAQALKTYQEAYVVVTAPTYTETGVAKNGKGETVELPILNDTNYTYSQVAADGTVYKYNNGQGGKAYFAHKTYSEIVIEKEITADTITFNWTDYNNVDINYKKTPDGMSARYIDGVYVFTISKDVNIPNFSMLVSTAKPSVKMVGEGNSLTLAYEANLANLTLDNLSFISSEALKTQSLTITGESSSVSVKSLTAADFVVDNGTFTYNSNLTSANITVKNSSVLTINGVIKTSNILVEKDSALTAIAAADTICVEANGIAQLYGTVTLTNKNADKTKTAINLIGGASLYLDENSRVTINAYEYAVSKWSGTGNGYFYYPRNATNSDDKYVIGDTVVFDCSSCKNKWFNAVTSKENIYTLVTAPTENTTGLASHPLYGEKVLQKLNTVDYSLSYASDAIAFTHNETGVKAASVAINVAEIIIGDLTVSYTAETGYTLSVADGKNVELSSGFTASSLTVSGKGALTINGSVTVTKLLLVESGATLNVTGVSGDAVNVKKDAVVKLFGTVDVKAVTGKTGVCFEDSANSAMYLSDTSRVTVSGGAYTIGHFSTAVNVKVYYPSGATVANNKITSANGNTLLSYGTTCKIEFVAES